MEKAKSTQTCRSKHKHGKKYGNAKQKHGKKTPTHVDLSTNKVFRHILTQEGQANNIKEIKQVRKKVDMLEKL